jgi:hypothetical protein
MLDTVDGTLTSQAETLNNARTQGGLRAALDLLFSPDPPKDIWRSSLGH